MKINPDQEGPWKNSKLLFLAIIVLSFQVEFTTAVVSFLHLSQPGLSFFFAHANTKRVKDEKFGDTFSATSGKLEKVKNFKVSDFIIKNTQKRNNL